MNIVNKLKLLHIECFIVQGTQCPNLPMYNLMYLVVNDINQDRAKTSGL